MCWPPRGAGGAGVVILMLAAACSIFGPPDLSRVQEFEVTAPDSLEEYDTLVPHARLLDGHGDSVPGPAFVWATLDTAILTVLDSTTGKTVVNHPGGTGRLLVRTATLVHDPVAIAALAAADTLFAVGATADTATLPDSLSDSLQVEIADTIASASGGDSLTVPLPRRPIEFAITYPAPPGSVTLVVNDTLLSTDTTVATGSQGVAAVKVRLIAGPIPDSVVVTARARRAVGTTVPGSPVTFVVRFLP